MKEFLARSESWTSSTFTVKPWSAAAANLAGRTRSTRRELDQNYEVNDSIAMKAKRRLLTREELLALEDKYFPGTLGNLLSLGAAHFRQSNRKNGRPAHRNDAGPRRKAMVG